MAEANDMYGSIYQNLLDAGCDQQTADQCMKATYICQRTLTLHLRRFTNIMR